MDAALLGGDSEIGGIGSPKRGRKHIFNRRSDAIAYGSPYEKAAALVDLAEDGIGIPEDIFDLPSFGSSLKTYLIYIQFDLLWTLNYFALLALNFFEKPLWCSKDCNNRDYYYLGQLPYLTSAESIVYEVLLLLVVIVDLSVYIIYISPVAFYTLPFRIAPYTRVVYFALNIRDIRDSIVVLAGMLRTYINVLALWLLFLLFSSWLAFVIFEDTQQGKIVFTSYGETLYQMFVLFTTSNNPDVWIPAYKASRWYSLFFVLYVLLGVYFVTNLILAVVYDSFKCENLGYLNKDQCIRLFEELNKYRTLPKISREDFELIFDELDDSHDVKINLDEFADLSHAIGLRFQKEDSEPVFESCPTFYHSPASENLKNFVRGPKFGYVVMLILILNFVAVVIETTLDIANNSGQGAWQKLEFIFGWLYVLEMALKVYSFGFENYWRDGQNRFDFVITWVIVIGETATFVSPRGLTFLSNGEWIRYLIIARMLRLIRLLMHVQQYRAFVATFLTLIPSLMPYLGTIFCVLCIYCSLGVQIFGGIVNAGNENLSGTDLYDNDYLLFNFNDYPNGMVTLFNLLVMGNWQAWMQSYKDLTGTAWTYAYFISFYLITILLLLNLVVAFVLEAFFAEIDIETSEKSEDGEGENGRDRRRNIGIKSRNQRVDMLLHHMLSAELKTESSTP
ncbi:hypothetical protein RD792_007026 [Penstemon davidsonii]|uniref:EF-hand domain-containing protein n=1 Tax=Penstemon davidsonii TaxID=160366 RepID=A0ABR0D5A7_9LAMI|nr:hypothetical protein RD792_007026 [Penstemon davidsonii]